MEMKLYNHLEFMFIELSYSLIKTSISIKNRSDNIRKGFLVRNFYEHFYALTCVKLCVCVCVRRGSCLFAMHCSNNRKMVKMSDSALGFMSHVCYEWIVES